MMMTKNIIIAALAVWGMCASAQTAGFRNEISVPDKVYMLSGVDNTLFMEPIVKRWRPYDDIVRFSGDAAYTRRTSRYVTVRPEAGTERRMVVDLVNTDRFDTLMTDTVTVLVGRKCTGGGEVTAQILGDSYVHGAFFRDALLDKGYVPGLRLVGLRGVKDADGQYDEGRGGWTVARYFEVSKGGITPYNGFMQPQDGRRYWGATAFWKNCFRVESGLVAGFDTVYNCSRFGRCLSKFDPVTGYLADPKRGDMMYDNGRERYVAYDGSRWRDAEVDESAWRFDYAKYLEMWQLRKPRFFFMLLGLNDFRDSLHACFGEWNRRVEQMARSYHEAVPEGRFVILLPCSTCGTLDNVPGDFTLRQNAAMWRLRRNIIAAFDRREAEGIYIVDMGAAIDGENGYRRGRDGLQTGNPHPYPNYPAMGVPLAAFLQYYR